MCCACVCEWMSVCVHACVFVCVWASVCVCTHYTLCYCIAMFFLFKNNFLMQMWICPWVCGRYTMMIEEKTRVFLVEETEWAGLRKHVFQRKKRQSSQMGFISSGCGMWGCSDRLSGNNNITKLPKPLQSQCWVRLDHHCGFFWQRHPHLWCLWLGSRFWLPIWLSWGALSFHFFWGGGGEGECFFQLWGIQGDSFFASSFWLWF